MKSINFFADLLASDLELSAMDNELNPLSKDTLFISRSLDLVNLRDTIEIVVETNLADTLKAYDPITAGKVFTINEYLRDSAEVSSKSLLDLNPSEVLVNTKVSQSCDRLVSTIHVKTQY